ncbi:uncharacterized protein LOC129591567 [Paramacrobiotus metropolitanus]|uniref:uncharacterized protein LOC129591567 n=1 Tax=Paramacrobiotus metropolitanus TaxID=2943436 RepID=UPI0024461270|nr:uncharacterized protein LOC129591567 [Paramacrobiotus metropolitanus]
MSTSSPEAAQSSFYLVLAPVSAQQDGSRPPVPITPSPDPVCARGGMRQFRKIAPATGIVSQNPLFIKEARRQAVEHRVSRSPDRYTIISSSVPRYINANRSSKADVRPRSEDAVDHVAAGDYVSIVLNKENVKVAEACIRCAGAAPGEPCPLHSHRIQDTEAFPFALATLPCSLYFLRRNPEELPIGVCTRESVPTGTVFGPMQGSVCSLVKEQPGLYGIPHPCSANGFKCFHLESIHGCNWMKFVQLAGDDLEQNLMSYISDGEVYFATTREIAADAELKVWYSPSYAKLLFPPGDMPFEQSDEIRERQDSDVTTEAESALPSPISIGEDSVALGAASVVETCCDENTEDLKISQNDPFAVITDSTVLQVISDEEDFPEVGRRVVRKAIRRIEAVLSVNPFQYPLGPRRMKAFQIAVCQISGKGLPQPDVEKKAVLLRNMLQKYSKLFPYCFTGVHPDNDDNVSRKFYSVMEKYIQIAQNGLTNREKVLMRVPPDTINKLQAIIKVNPYQFPSDTDDHQKAWRKVALEFLGEEIYSGNNLEKTAHDLQKFARRRLEVDAKKLEQQYPSSCDIVRQYVGLMHELMNLTGTDKTADAQCDWLTGTELSSSCSDLDTHDSQTATQNRSSYRYIPTVPKQRKRKASPKSEDEIRPASAKEKKRSSEKKPSKSKFFVDPAITVKYPCTICKIHFKSEALWKLHTEFHESSNVSIEENDQCEKICPECGEECDSLTTLYQHVENHGVNYFGKERCQICQKFIAAHIMDRHIKGNHPPTEETGTEEFKCDVCGKVFSSEMKHRAHVQMHKVRKCLICAEIFDSWVELGKHHLIHKEGDGFHCRNCDFVAATFRRLTNHHRRRHDIRSITMCKVCGEMCKNKETLFRHMQSRHNYACRFSFECEVCGMKFRKASTLQHHVAYKHTTARRNKIIESQKRRAKERQGKDYVGPRKRMLLEEFPFKCPHCEVGFVIKGRYLRHVNRFHPDVLSSGSSSES